MAPHHTSHIKPEALWSQQRGLHRERVDVLCVCVCCVVIPFILDVRLVYAPAGVTQEEGHTGFLIHLASAVLAFIFIAGRIQPSLSLIDREVKFCVPTN